MKSIQLVMMMLLGLGALSSCGPTLSPFTDRLYETYRWDEEDLRRIQFYLSEDIVLRREHSGGKSEIVGGEIKVIEGREVDEIVIRRGTPGVFLFSPKSERFAISFEGKTEEKFLMFGPNPKMGNRYMLLGSNWDRSQGTVTYDGRSYEVSSASAYAGLLVDLKKIRRESTRSRVATGRRID